MCLKPKRELLIIAALPGVAPEAVRVEIEGETLMIAGMRPLPCQGGGSANILRLEIPYGRFERRIALASRLRLAERELRNGCLILTFAKLSEPSPVENHERHRTNHAAIGRRPRNRRARKSATRAPRTLPRARAQASCKLPEGAMILFRRGTRCCSRASSCRSRSAARNRSRARRRPPSPTGRSACFCRRTRRSTRPALSIFIRSAPSPRSCVTSPRPTATITGCARHAALPRARFPAEGYPFLVAKVEEIGEAEIYSTEIAARMHQLKERAREAISLLPNVPPEIATRSIRSRRRLRSPISSPTSRTSASAEKQDLLETFDVGERLDKLLRYLAQQIEVLRLSKQIGEQTQESLVGRQREHILREQLRQIQKELGEGEDSAGRDRGTRARQSRRPACPRRPKSRRARS